MDKPKMLKEIDWSEVIGMAEEMLEDEDDGDSDNIHYLYESVMEAVYGKNVWQYINQRS